MFLEKRTDILAAKRILRKQVQAELERMAPEPRAAASARARATHTAQPLWQRAHSVLFFAPLREELDVWPLLAEALSAGKQVALPRFVVETRSYVACQIENPETEVKVGHFGIREPVVQCIRLASNRVDLILVPGVAFDLHGHRLGRGKGYYDQLLSGFRGITCGVGFDEQIVETVPVEEHDFRLNYVLTPTRWISGAQRG
jgi:5-formyltetrahydrofolate cyclo-ligase